jgi:hypothetical protein
MDLLQMDIPKKVYTIQDYFERVDSAPIYRSGGTHFDLPIEYNYAAVLSSIFYKWKTGQGGNEMWAGNSMNAKTFGIADKERTTKEADPCGRSAWWALYNVVGLYP